MAEPLIDLLADVWSAIDRLGTGLTAEQWATPTDCPGWTVQDQVVHVVGTERMLLGDPAPAVAADVQSYEHVKNDIGAFNEQWIESRRAWSGAEVLAEFRDVTGRRLEQLRALTPEEWDTVGFTPEGPGPYRSFMAIRVFDCWMHEQDIREALGQPGGREGRVAELAMEKLRGAMPYVVGKRAGAPQGSTVVFDVSGPRGFVLPVGVEGRAAVLDDAPANPTVRLLMDDRTFERLAGGRWDGRAALDDGRVRCAGDAGLGRAVVAAMGFTI